MTSRHHCGTRGEVVDDPLRDDGSVCNKSSPPIAKVVSICRVARSDLTTIKQRFGNRPFRVREAVDAGIPRHALYRLRDQGALQMLSRGVMQPVDSDPAMNTEFAALAARVPKGTICLNSGLSYWELSDELPATIHLAVPRGAHWPKIDTPATTLHRFAAETFELERLEQATDAGEPFWIYSAERCVVDAMRLQHVVGRDVALSALSRYARRRGADPLRLTGPGAATRRRAPDPGSARADPRVSDEQARRVFRQLQALARADYGGNTGAQSWTSPRE